MIYKMEMELKFELIILNFKDNFWMEKKWTRFIFINLKESILIQSRNMLLAKW